MPRPPRIIYKGAVYHVYQRGNNKEFIFDDNLHKAYLIKKLKEYNKVFDYEILAYVIMSNHYHLLIRANNSSISEIMFYLNNCLSKYLAKELNRRGHIFEGRFKCKLVEDESYLIWLLRYIHRNPIRAKIVEQLDEYLWSSHYFYKNNNSNFVNINFILDLLSSNRASALQIYNNFVAAEGDDSNCEKDFEIVRDLFFVNSKFNNALSKEKTYIRQDLIDIFNRIATSDEIKNSILSGKRNRDLTSYKLEFIKNALEEKYTVSEISYFLCCSESGVRRLIERYNLK